jgi:hypothetical protein
VAKPAARTTRAPLSLSSFKSCTLVFRKPRRRLPAGGAGSYNGVAMDLIATPAARQPDLPAIIDGDTVLSWRDFFERRNDSPMDSSASGSSRATM